MNICAIVVAAGKGRRMLESIPKQYLMLGERCILDHTLEKLLDFQGVAMVVVTVRKNDVHWESTRSSRRGQVHVCQGGETRFESVCNALEWVEHKGILHQFHWILVHDAVRPFFLIEDLSRLIAKIDSKSAGGILSCPLGDTVHRVSSNKIICAVERSKYVRAMTPQVFRPSILCKALHQARENGWEFTDEAGAVCSLGHTVEIFRSSATNIKITTQSDLLMARAMAGSPP